MSYAPRSVDPLAAVIGANAHDLRNSAGRTLADVAVATGISESMMSKIENGVAFPRVQTLVNLARALGVNPGALFETQAEGAAA